MYWEERYKSGGNSGIGSYDKFALFKAKIINEFIKENKIDSIIELGCGDGNQISLGDYPIYIGLDVSPTVIQICIKKFEPDLTKSFFLYHSNCFSDRSQIFSADLTLSLDVLYHLTEEEVYYHYLKHLFAASKKYVIVYSSNQDIPLFNNHETHREFTRNVAEMFGQQWKLIETVKNEYPANDIFDPEGSIADFFIFKKRGKH